MNRRMRIVLMFVLSFTVLLAQRTPLTASQSSAAENEKCSFLRQELTRVESAVPALPETVPAATAPAYLRYAKEAAAGVVEAKVASCKKGERLSSLGRLRNLENARRKEIEKVREEVTGPAADTIVDALNQFYEGEARSFYNTFKVAVSDRDVAKDFPKVVELLEKSTMDDEHKKAILKNFRFIRYDEAGRLQNALLGLDKDAGTTFPYILRDDLGGRAQAEEKQAEKDEKTRAANVKKAVLQARITLSVSMLMVVRLAGYLVFRREIIPLQAYLTIVGAAAALGLMWILVTLGLWAWIQSYLNIAF